MTRTLMLCGLLSVCIVAGVPCAAQPTWRLIEDLRLGVSVDGPDSFGNVGPIVVTKNANIFVVDDKPLQIKLFSPAGKFLRNVGRTGGGPGEYTEVNAMVLNAQGNVQVVASTDGRVLVFSPNGTLVRQITTEFPNSGGRWEGTMAADGSLLDPIHIRTSGRSSATGEQRLALQRVRPDGTRGVTMMFPGCALRHTPPQAYLQFNNADGSSWEIRIPNLPSPQTVFASDGTAWCAPGDIYAVYHFRLGRPDTIHVARMNVPAPALTDSQRVRLQRMFSRAVNGKTAEVPKVLPTISLIRVDDSNRLWVRRTATPDAAPVFDAFDAQGRLLAVVKTNLRWIGIPLVVGDLAYGSVLSNDGIPFVVRARIRQ